MKDDNILIETRFHGPPESGNGGYVCGRLAQFIDSPAAIVRLHVPPRLSTRSCRCDAAEAGVELFNNNVLVAEARPTRVVLEPPEPPSYEEAEAASRWFRGFRSHCFPSCFVCGPDRHPGDGLRIFAGPIDGRDLVASPWIPDSSLASATGLVSAEFLWAALDCPGAYAFPEPAQGAVLLGELQVVLLGDVSVDERCVLVAYELAHQGRKHHTVTALYGGAGACLGLGLGTWFEVDQDRGRNSAQVS